MIFKSFQSHSWSEGQSTVSTLHVCVESRHNTVKSLLRNTEAPEELNFELLRAINAGIVVIVNELMSMFMYFSLTYEQQGLMGLSPGILGQQAKFQILHLDSKG